MNIITVPDPRLRKASTKVNHVTEETHQIIKQMVDASLEWEKEHPHELSAAMAAPQVIKASGKLVSDYEGCLSVPFIYGLVPRYSKLRVKAKLIDGTEVRIKAEDNLARTLAHEIDHLDGILFIDHIKDDKKAFFELDKDGDLKPLDYDSRIKNNPELFGDE